MFGSKIVASGESQIVLALDESNPWKLLADHFPATIEGRVVEDESLEANSFRSRVDAGQALSHEVHGLPVDDDDREIHRCPRWDVYSHILSSRRRRRICCFLMYRI